MTAKTNILKVAFKKDVFIIFPGPAIDYGHGEEPSAPPLLGEHTRHVLKDILNFTEDEINEFAKKKIIQE